MSAQGVLLFHTTSAAIRAEKRAKLAGIPARLVPAPRELSSDCGLALRYPWEQSELLRALLCADGIELAGVHRLG